MEMECFNIEVECKANGTPKPNAIYNRLNEAESIALVNGFFREQLLGIGITNFEPGLCSVGMAFYRHRICVYRYLAFFSIPKKIGCLLEQNKAHFVAFSSNERNNKYQPLNVYENERNHEIFVRVFRPRYLSVCNSPNMSQMFAYRYGCSDAMVRNFHFLIRCGGGRNIQDHYKNVIFCFEMNRCITLPQYKQYKRNLSIVHSAEYGLITIGGYTDGARSARSTRAQVPSPSLSRPSLSPSRRKKRRGVTEVEILCVKPLHDSNNNKHDHNHNQNYNDDNEIEFAEHLAWRGLSDMNCPRYWHSSSLMGAHSEYIITTGGLNNKSSEMYSFSRNNWMKIANMPEHRFRHGIYFCSENEKLIVGGGKNTEQTVRMYDANHDQWVSLANTKYAHGWYPCISSFQPRVIAIAGGDGKQLGFVEFYDFRAGNGWMSHRMGDKPMTAPTNLPININIQNACNYASNQNVPSQFRRVFQL